MDSARSRFLCDGSRYLFEAASTTSAHLSAESLALRRDAPAKNDLSCCQSCGTLFIPAITMDLELRGMRKKPKRLKQKSRASPSQRVVNTSAMCIACGRHSRRIQSVLPKPPAARQGLAEPNVQPCSVAVASQSQAPVTDTVLKQPVMQPSESKLSSKQRAKARKDRESLQALLSKSKVGTPSTGLSFMDMMKK